jgi:hypothetical protein
MNAPPPNDDATFARASGCRFRPSASTMTPSSFLQVSAVYRHGSYSLAKSILRLAEASAPVPASRCPRPRMEDPTRRSSFGSARRKARRLDIALAAPCRRRRPFPLPRSAHGFKPALARLLVRRRCDAVLVLQGMGLPATASGPVWQPRRRPCPAWHRYLTASRLSPPCCIC